MRRPQACHCIYTGGYRAFGITRPAPRWAAYADAEASNSRFARRSNSRRWSSKMKTIAYFSPWRHRSSRAGPLIAHIDTSNANWRRVQIVSHEERWTLTFFVTETVSEVFRCRNRCPLFFAAHQGARERGSSSCLIVVVGASRRNSRRPCQQLRCLSQ